MGQTEETLGSAGYRRFKGLAAGTGMMAVGKKTGMSTSPIGMMNQDEGPSTA
jgi:hypothetical protein